ncbi:MAG: hypothetical protein OXG65_08510 [Chloroflexi bacterium]|nr:hypothetical protein [Chloroflexota bacterium]
MDTSQGDEINLIDQEPADDTLTSEDARLAEAITQGLSTKPVSKQQVIEALQPPSPKPSRLP